MSEFDRPTYGVDLITFYHPQFWGVDTFEDIATLSPETIWTTILDATTAAGIGALELTFGPADWRSAIAAFGSAEGFRKELEARDTVLKSGFHVALGWDPQTDRKAAAAEAAEYAEFIAAAGGDTLVVGPPMRRTRSSENPLFVDTPYITALADVLHHVGAATLDHGVRTAVHTEAHSVFCTRRDVDLLMTATDPLFVAMCPDTGHLTLSGADPSEVMAAHHERMVMAHWKDATGPMPLDVPIDDGVHLSHREYFRRVGAGTVDWNSWIDVVRKTPYTDVVVLELDAVPDPVAEMTAAREHLQQLLG